MLPENRIINALWVGNNLSMLEMLTLHSFTSNGHVVHLWVYETIFNTLPSEVVLKDANLIIPAKEIFVRKHLDPVAGVGKGSLGAPFSDLFRYKLLYEIGGWWVDMDVTCLKPLDVTEPYFFRDHLFLDVIGNVIKCPKGSELMHRTYEVVKSTCDEDTLDWLLPNKILVNNIRELGLLKYKKHGISNKDEWNETKRFITKRTEIPKDWIVIHWTNEEWRMHGIYKNSIRTWNSTLGDLIEKYKVPHTNPNYLKLIINEISFFSPKQKIIHLIHIIYYFFSGHFLYYWKKIIRAKNRKE